MHLAVYLPLLMPLLAAAAARPLAGRLPPAAAAWLLALSAIALALASSAVLGMLALTALVRIPLVESLAGMSGRVISQRDPASVPVAITAGALLAAAAAAACRASWRRARALIAAGREARHLPGPGQVVVTDDEAADAYTLPGLPCRIVITTGMLRALTGPERQVLLAHERAHASALHYVFTTAARLAAAANPLLRPVASAVGYTVERWADERAAAVTGDRELAARAIARAALAATAAPPRQAGRAATALSAVSIPARIRRAGPVPRRAAALLRPHRSRNCCCSPLPSCWSPCPACPPWKPPATCTPCSNPPAPPPPTDRAPFAIHRTAEPDRHRLFRAAHPARATHFHDPDLKTCPASFDLVAVTFSSTVIDSTGNWMSEPAPAACACNSPSRSNPIASASHRPSADSISRPVIPMQPTADPSPAAVVTTGCASSKPAR